LSLSILDQTIQIIDWLPAFLVILGVNLFVSHRTRVNTGGLWAASLFVLLVPLAFPGNSNSLATVARTFITTQLVVTAVRLADLRRVQRGFHPSPLELFLWMSLPMARFFPKELSQRNRNRRRAIQRIAHMGFLLLVWQAVSSLLAIYPALLVYWPLRSALLILFFVVHICAAAGAATSLCLALGLNVDELFDSPFLSSSPRDFWGRRWNKFINRFALKHVAMPLQRRNSSALVLVGVFLASGLFHEYFAWGISGTQTRPGAMMLFFFVQGTMIWGGTKISLKLPRWLGTLLTFCWMALTAPLFFWALLPGVLAFGYPEAWLPF